MHIHRVKNGKPAVHPIIGDWLRALRRLRREDPEGRYVFRSELKAPMTPVGVRGLINRSGAESGLPFPVHPHMLRHACGYKLANDGHNTRAVQAYLGHRNIQHTVRYTDEEFARGPSRPGIFPYPRSVGDFGTPLVEPAPEIRDDSLRVALTINFAEFLLTN